MSQILVELIKFANLILNITSARSPAAAASASCWSSEPSLLRAETPCRSRSTPTTAVSFHHVTFTLPRRRACRRSRTSTSPLSAARPSASSAAPAPARRCLVNLIPPLLRRGRRRASQVDGVDVRDYPLDALRGQDRPRAAEGAALPGHDPRKPALGRANAPRTRTLAMALRDGAGRRDRRGARRAGWTI